MPVGLLFGGERGEGGSSTGPVRMFTNQQEKVVVTQCCDKKKKSDVDLQRSFNQSANHQRFFTSLLCDVLFTWEALQRQEKNEREWVRRVPRKRSARKRWHITARVLWVFVCKGSLVWNMKWVSGAISLYRWRGPGSHQTRVWQRAVESSRERVRRIRMYFRSEASGALLQLVSEGRKDFKGGT